MVKKITLLNYHDSRHMFFFRIFALTMVSLLMSGFVVSDIVRTGATEQSGDIKVFIGEQPLRLEDPPIIRDGRTLVPMRAFFEALGAGVTWDANTKTAIGIRGNVEVRIPIDSKEPNVNGAVFRIDVPAQIINGRTFIPLRFVGEALGDAVRWEGATKSIFITKLHPPESQLPVEPSVPEKISPGFSGMGEGTFGGSGGEVVTVTNSEEFRKAVEGNTPRIVQVSGSIDLGPGMAARVGSYKTIVGLGEDAKLLGGGLVLNRSSQVIIRNLRLGNAITPGFDPAAGGDAVADALHISRSTNIWIDQCTFKNDPEIWEGKEESFDGLLDIVNASTNITISNNIFENHNQTMLIGNSDSLFADRGFFRVTLFNNWFKGTESRHPRVRFGRVHVFNNYFDDVGYGIGVGVEARIISENNYFRSTGSPWQFMDRAAQQGFIKSVGDVFVDSDTIPARPEGVNWAAREMYSYRLLQPEVARSYIRVRSGAGRANRNLYVDNQPSTVTSPKFIVTGTSLQKTQIRIYNNARFISAGEVNKYADFSFPLTLDRGGNNIEVRAADDIVRISVTLNVP